MNLDEYELNRLASTIFSLMSKEAKTTQFRKGVVTAVVPGTPATLTVTLSGTSVSGLRYANSYDPKVGDVVLTLRDRGEDLVLFSIASPEKPWTNLTLTSGFSNYIGTAQYKRYPGNIVRLRGTVTRSPITEGIVLTTLPSGYRPAQQTLVTTAVYDSGTPCRLLVRTTGEVEIYGAVTNFVSLDNLTFDVT